MLNDLADLERLVNERTRAALAAGALRPIATEQAVVSDGGVDYLVRVVDTLRRKEADRRRREDQAREGLPPANPFLPPEPALRVADVPPRHVAVLNKFNVLDRHLLIVTRAFEHQETLLDRGDFAALLACMQGMDGLGFYNGGRVAGASQTHKHLQLVPLPLAPSGPPLPMAPLLEGDGPRCPRLPFAHAFGRLSGPAAGLGASGAGEAEALYRRLMGEAGVPMLAAPDGERQGAPYNLLVAGDWMLLVPRSAECFQGVSVNALGFAGSLFVRERTQLERIRSVGPRRVLADVSGAASPPEA